MGLWLQFMFFPVDLYALTGLIGGGWYLSLGCGGWYTWPGDWVQSTRQGQRFHPPRHCNTLNTTRTCVQHQLNILVLKNIIKIAEVFVVILTQFCHNSLFCTPWGHSNIKRLGENSESRIISALGWLAMVPKKNPRASCLLLMLEEWGNASHQDFQFFHISYMYVKLLKIPPLLMNRLILSLFCPTKYDTNRWILI